MAPLLVWGSDADSYYIETCRKRVEEEERSLALIEQIKMDQYRQLVHLFFKLESWSISPDATSDGESDLLLIATTNYDVS